VQTDFWARPLPLHTNQAENIIRGIWRNLVPRLTSAWSFNSTPHTPYIYTSIHGVVASKILCSKNIYVNFSVAEVCETKGDWWRVAVSLVTAAKQTRKKSRFLFLREGKQAVSASFHTACIATSIKCLVRLAYGRTIHLISSVVCSIL
jgi:hypothetical protein